MVLTLSGSCCSSISYTFGKLKVRSRGLIRFMLNIFSKTVSQVMMCISHHIRRHIISDCHTISDAVFDHLTKMWPQDHSILKLKFSLFKKSSAQMWWCNLSVPFQNHPKFVGNELEAITDSLYLMGCLCRWALSRDYPCHVSSCPCSTPVSRSSRMPIF